MVDAFGVCTDDTKCDVPNLTKSNHTIEDKSNRSREGDSIGHSGIDVERIEPTSEAPALIESRQAGKRSTLGQHDDTTGITQEKAKTSAQAVRDEDESQYTQLQERGVDANTIDIMKPPLTQAQDGRLAGWLPKQSKPATPRIRISSCADQLTIEGYFPANTKVDISTHYGTRQIIASRQPITARNMSSGRGSFQFIGDIASLAAILGDRDGRNT